MGSVCGAGGFSAESREPLVRKPNSNGKTCGVSRRSAEQRPSFLTWLGSNWFLANWEFCSRQQECRIAAACAFKLSAHRLLFATCVRGSRIGAQLSKAL